MNGFWTKFCCCCFVFADIHTIQVRSHSIGQFLNGHWLLAISLFVSLLLFSLLLLLRLFFWLEQFKVKIFRRISFSNSNDDVGIYEFCMCVFVFVFILSQARISTELLNLINLFRICVYYFVSFARVKKCPDNDWQQCNVSIRLWNRTQCKDRTVWNSGQWIFRVLQIVNGLFDIDKSLEVSIGFQLYIQRIY